jgi:parvulin-like peptidyl-prolyl isomerase
VIKLEEMRDAQIPPFEQVKAQIAESLQQRKLQTFQQDLKKKSKNQVIFSITKNAPEKNSSRSVFLWVPVDSY